MKLSNQFQEKKEFNLSRRLPCQYWLVLAYRGSLPPLNIVTTVTSLHRYLPRHYSISLLNIHRGSYKILFAFCDFSDIFSPTIFNIIMPVYNLLLYLFLFYVFSNVQKSPYQMKIITLIDVESRTPPTALCACWVSCSHSCQWGFADYQNLRLSVGKGNPPKIINPRPKI